MKSALWVLSIFAAVWCAAGLSTLAAPRWTLALAAIPSAAVMIAAYAVPRRPSRGQGKRIARLVAVWSAVEVAAMLVAANLLVHFGRPRMVLPAVAVIVGLHFLPLARGIPQRSYWAVAALMVAAGALGIAGPSGWAPAASALACALVLWGECAVLLARPRA